MEFCDVPNAMPTLWLPLMKFLFPLVHKTSLHYRPDIDGLRAVAILLVIVFHAIPEALPGGFIGVDIFFVISGYLITGILLKDMSAGHFSYLNFYARRFRRIVPALITVLTSILLLGWILLLSDEYSNVARNIVAGATFTTNFILLHQPGYFEWSAELNPLLHLWSLGIEEQFYLVWPPILLLILRRSQRIAIYTLLLLVISFGLNAYFVSGNETKVFFLLPTRLWELLVGCLLTITETSGSLTAERFSNAKSIAGATLLAASIYFINKGESYPGWWALMPTISSFLIISSGPCALINRTLLANKPMLLIGLISYPLYLWHWPLLSIAKIVEGKLSTTVVLGILGLSAILAFLTWQFIELPAQLKLFLHHHKTQRDKNYVTSALALIFIISSFGLLVVYKDGFPGRYQEYESAREKLERHALHNIPQEADCRKLYGLQKSDCSTSGPNPSIAFIGDSHAWHLFTGMKFVADEKKQGVIYLGKGGCPPLKGVDTIEYDRDHDKKCTITFDDYVRFFSSSFDTVKTVVLASLGPSYISGHDFGDGRHRWSLVSSQPQDKDASQQALYLAGTSRIIDFLEAKGKQVIFFADNPELGFRPATCMIQRPVQLLHKEQQHCSIPTAVVYARQAEYREIIAKLKLLHPKLEVFDSTSYWCNQETCFISQDGNLLYLDKDHLDFQGSKFIAEKFFSWLGIAESRVNGTVKINN